jgi:hypothetical protein
VPASTDPAQDVGGFWNGSPHVGGVTYALHHVTVSGGTLQVSVVGLGGHSGSVNAFQLVELGSPVSIYCTQEQLASCTRRRSAAHERFRDPVS